VDKFLKTVINTIPKSYNYRFYIGIDNDEKVYTIEALTDVINKFGKENGYNFFSTIIIYKDIKKGHLTKMWNVLFEEAHKLGVHDYYYQCGDDIEFLTDGWLEESIKMLKKNNDVGIAGPLVKNDNFMAKLLTQGLFSNRHYDFFGYLFPEVIINWYCDNWLNDVYKENKFKLNDHLCKNSSVRTTNERYDINKDSTIFRSIILDDIKIAQKCSKLVKSKPILVIANGKTASQIDWKWLKDNRNKIDIFCMNSIYKKFEEFGVYPDYYASLDDVVTECHKDNLQKMVNDMKIKKCFYLGTCYYNKKYATSFNGVDSYYPINKISSNKSDIKVSESNLEFNSWSNTGSDCLQLAIMMGYKDIYLIGADGYVEKINESKQLKTGALEITETPKDNPNYFFSTYQEAGEKYNVPNASKCHLPGWKHSVNVCKELGINLFNMSNPDYITTMPKITYDDFVKKIE
jgi:hypothetical protein